MKTPHRVGLICNVEGEGFLAMVSSPVRCMSLGLVVLACGTSAAVYSFAQNAPNEFRISVTDSRPVAAAATEIEKRFGVIVTYEDPPYFHESQSEDVTGTVSRLPEPRQRVLVPKRRELTLIYQLQRVEPRLEAAYVLDQVLRQARSIDPGSADFRLDGSEGAIHIVPTATKGKSGRPEQYASLLDTRITLAYGQDTGMGVVEHIVQAVSKKTGRMLVVGAAPLGPSLRSQQSRGAQNEVARDLLWGALQQIHPRLSWRIFCDPGGKQYCYLSVHGVPEKR